MHWYEDDDLWVGFAEVTFPRRRDEEAERLAATSPRARDRAFGLAQRSVLTLSGGERQRVLVALHDLNLAAAVCGPRNAQGAESLASSLRSLGR